MTWSVFPTTFKSLWEKNKEKKVAHDEKVKKERLEAKKKMKKAKTTLEGQPGTLEKRASDA